MKKPVKNLQFTEKELDLLERIVRFYLHEQRDELDELETQREKAKEHLKEFQLYSQEYNAQERYIEGFDFQEMMIEEDIDLSVKIQTKISKEIYNL